MADPHAATQSAQDADIPIDIPESLQGLDPHATADHAPVATLPDGSTDTTDASGLIDQLQFNLTDFLEAHGAGHSLANAIMQLTTIAVVVLLAILANYLAKKLLVRVLQRLAQRTETTWDDILINRKVPLRLSHLAPAAVIGSLAPIAFESWPAALEFVERMVAVYMTIIGVAVVDALLTAVVDIYRTFTVAMQRPIKAYVGVGKILAYAIGVVLIVCALLDKPPGLFLTGLGAFTAVLMLVFRDSILGLVAGVQLARNDMVRIGDWIDMPNYGADGDVVDITLHTVKVQNWDKTITTIPTYALVSNSFKNWRGMSESGGRRIKRALYIDMTSIGFCDQAMIERFEKIHLLQNYIANKRTELAEYNAKHNIDDAVLVNGRRMTNIGTFRAYVAAYLRNHPKIHQYMTFLVRQLPPGPTGLPLEIYVFSNDQVWANYEAIQADIFDHMLAVVPEFGLRVFQNPSGADVRESIQGLTITPAHQTSS